MRGKRIIWFFIVQAVVVLIVLALIKATQLPQLETFRDQSKNRFTALLGGFSDQQSTPTRRPPLVFDELQAYLITYLGEPFVGFDPEDWRWFWSLMYEGFTQDAQGWFEKKRQLTREEIQDQLVGKYPQPFGRFGPEQWKIFWMDILKGRVFKE